MVMYSLYFKIKITDLFNKQFTRVGKMKYNTKTNNLNYIISYKINIQGKLKIIR